MALRQTKKISELPALSPASLDTTFVVGISGSTTYKISINQLTSSLDTTFATDLVTATLSGSLDGKLTTSSFNSYTASISTASLVTSISNLNTFSSSIYTSWSADNSFIRLSLPYWSGSVNTSISNLNTFTSSQSTSSLVNRLNVIESVSGSWITESETGSFLTSLSGAISSSAQITTFGFVSGSYETTGRGIISSSANLVTTSSFNSYTASISTASLVTSISNLNSATSSYLTSLSGAISSSSQVIGILSSLNSVSASLISKTGSYATTGSNTFYGDQIMVGNPSTQRVELSVGETYGGGKVFKILSGSYALIVDMNDLGAAQGQYMQVATNATSTTGSVNQSLILARSGSVPNDYNFLLPGNAAHQLGGQYYGLDMEDPAVMAYSSSVGGYNDWYIPSTTEITWINQGVAGRLYEGFSQANYYWTSNYGGATYVVSDGASRTTSGAADSTQHPVVAIRKINQSYREVITTDNTNISITGSLSVSGSITGSTNFDTIVNKPTLISGSAQLTSSYDTRYALSASFVSSSNLSSIRTITSASYAALTPVSGTLYIIIG